MILSIVIIVILILNIFAKWMLFSRAGRDGWRSIIPLYNQFVAHQITFGEDMGILFLVKFIPFVGPAYSMYTSYCFSRSFNGGDVLSVFSIIFQPLTNVILAFGGNGYIGSNINFLYRIFNRNEIFYNERNENANGNGSLNNYDLQDNHEYTKEETITVVEDDQDDSELVDRDENN